MTRRICCGIPYAMIIRHNHLGGCRIESLLKILVVDLQLPLPFSALFDDVAQSEDLVCASLSLHPCSKTCWLFSESLVHCFRDPPSYSVVDSEESSTGSVPVLIKWRTLLHGLKASVKRIDLGKDLNDCRSHNRGRRL